MLPSELLLSYRRSGNVYPRFIKGEQIHWSERVLSTIQQYQHKTRAELHNALKALEGDSPDYRIVRGFAHLALNKTEFTISLQEPEPETLRHQAFQLASERGYGEVKAREIITELANQYQLTASVVQEALYADLPERHVVTVLPEYTAETLLDRYNLAQAQGLLYSAMFLRIAAHRNVPGEYRRLFHRLKFHGLMYAVEGNLDDGYQIHVDGPASLFRQTRKYGINMAIFLPALLTVTRWDLQAVLHREGKEYIYNINSNSPLRSHYPEPPEYDSLLEKRFAERWLKLDTGWELEREVEIIDLKGTVMVPDFALRHSDGRTAHIEIMGFWHPDYIRRKLDKVRRAARNDLILAVSERLNVGDEDIADIPGPVIFFKGKLEPKQVLPVLEYQAFKPPETG